MLKRFLFIFLILLISTPMSYAYDPDDLMKLKGFSQCLDCDLSNANLKGMDLTDVTIDRTNLKGADLNRADLTGVDLRGNILRGADLTKANLTGADLNGVDLFKADLSKANLNGAKLMDANLKGANLFGARNLVCEQVQSAQITRDTAVPIYMKIDWVSDTKYTCEDQITLLKQGAKVWNAWRVENPSITPYFVNTNLEGAKLMDANLKGANLFGANLNRANLNRADLNGANLSDTILTDTILIATKLNKAKLIIANLKGTNLEAAKLFEAKLRKANLSGAYLKGAILLKSDLSGANLSKADLSGAELNKAVLVRTNLEDAVFFETKMVDTVYEPIHVPLVSTMSEVKGLASLRISDKGTPSGLNLLREAFKKAGMREQERQVTYAIKHGERIDKGIIERTFHLILFELTCKYGMYPGRPLRILLVLILIFSISYYIAIRFGHQKIGNIFLLSFKEQKSGIWRVWPEDRIHKMQGQDNPDRVRATGFGAFLWAVYVSLLSAFHFGWRDLNIGNWLARIHPQEFSLRTTGWVKVVSGIQSLISVYLVALWALSYFGRPFE